MTVWNMRAKKLMPLSGKVRPSMMRAPWYKRRNSTMMTQFSPLGAPAPDSDQLLNAAGLYTLTDDTSSREHNRFHAFDVCVYNSAVRGCLKANEEHPLYNDRWADPQHVIVLVKDEAALAQRLCQMFPVADGFVIQNIHERRLPDVV
jgi:hypothetical protein